MARTSQHGIDLEKAARLRDVQRDARTLGQRCAVACRKPEVLGVACVLLAGVAWFAPALVDIAALGGVVVGLLSARLQPELPLKLPATYRGLDPHEWQPGTRRPRPARGLLFLGNDRTTGEELYLSDDDVRTHFLVLGGTGSGKTEAMTSLAANTLLWGSGFTYVDGKGDAALWAKVLALARACGREDDVYVLNYLTGSTDIEIGAPGAARLSNTFNPFLYGSADALTQLLVAQMAEAGGDSATWKDKAIGLLTAYVRTLVAMRDAGRDEQGQPLVLDVGVLRAYLTLDRLIDLYVRARDRVDGFTLPGAALAALSAYLESVPGFQDPARLAEAQGLALTPEVIRTRAYPAQPDPQTYLQHGYLQNQFGRMFGQLADVYGHIFRAGHGEIDLADVVLNRRILVVLLPPLEKSPDELASLGKLLIASLKTMLAIGLGARLEGHHREVIESRPMAAPAPYLGVFDEYGYYAVKGFAVVPAQARSLGLAVCFGGQDLQSFGKESQEEAAAIVANTLTKAAMFIEDPKDTAELFEKLGGHALAVQTSGYTRSDHLLGTGLYRDVPNAGFERRARLDPLDLREQVTGEAHVFRGTTMVRANLFYAGDFKVREYRLNRFVPLGPLDAAAVRDHRDTLTLDGLRQAVARVITPSLAAGSGEVMSVQPAVESPPDPSIAAADEVRRQTFAQRWINAYLQDWAALDAQGAAQLRHVAAHAARDDAESEDPSTDEATISNPIKSMHTLQYIEESLPVENETAIDPPLSYLGFPVEHPDDKQVAGGAIPANRLDGEAHDLLGSPDSGVPRRVAARPRRIAVDSLEFVDFVIDAEQALAGILRRDSARGPMR
ncbi:MAG TPA: hypothetical protein P5330_07060 [Candidatus Competibacteraceae bacterium]|nr:hypothetical protein [Candidatus Competibacteraceae bacterium]